MARWEPGLSSLTSKSKKAIHHFFYLGGKIKKPSPSERGQETDIDILFRHRDHIPWCPLPTAHI